MLFVGAVPVHGATTTNLQLANPGGFLVQGEITLFVVDEAAQGNTDLNGDGDAIDDFVLHFYNSTAGTTTNVGLVITTAFFDGNNIALIVDEAKQGGTDLNGDADATDNVLHIYDIAAGTTANVGLDSGIIPVIDGNNVAFVVSEASQGNTDLNGDADATDNVLHVYDITAGTTANVGLDSGFPAIDGNNVAFVVSEFNQGNTDLNGDADTSDHVLHVYDITAGTTTNVGFDSVNPQLDGNSVAFAVSEGAQGNTDLNGDADTNDFVLHVYDITAGTTANVGLQSFNLVLDGNNVAFAVNETGQGNTDLNGDADATDDVLHVYDITAGTTANVGLYSLNFVLDGNNVAFAVNEANQGNTDLNGDADTNDVVLHVYDITAGTTTNVGLHSFNFVLDGNNVAFLVNEFNQGNTDLNGDADSTDSNILHVYDITAGTTANVGLASSSLQLDGNNIAFAVDEAGQGNTDLNGDADTSDDVLHVYDIAAGTTANVGLASTLPTLDGNTLAFSVSEASQGSTDLNGDADTLDDVAHIYDLTLTTKTSQATGQVDVAQTCGLLIIAGDPIEYGSVFPGDTSAEKTLTLDNTGNTDLTALLVKGTDWLDGASTEMTVDNTRFSTASGGFETKTTLATTDKTITSAFSASTDLDSFWQLQVNLIDSAFSGSLTQTLDLTVTC